MTFAPTAATTAHLDSLTATVARLTNWGADLAEEYACSVFDTAYDLLLVQGLRPEAAYLRFRSSPHLGTDHRGCGAYDSRNERVARAYWAHCLAALQSAGC